MSTTREEVYKAIDTERAYQDQLNERTLTIGDEILLLIEYTARARTEWSNEFEYPEEKTLEMVRKVAGIATRCLENHGVKPRQYQEDLGVETINGFNVRFARVHPDGYIGGTFSFDMDDVQRIKLEGATDRESAIAKAREIIGDRRNPFA